MSIFKNSVARHFIILCSCLLLTSSMNIASSAQDCTFLNKITTCEKLEHSCMPKTGNIAVYYKNDDLDEATIKQIISGIESNDASRNITVISMEKAIYFFSKEASDGYLFCSIADVFSEIAKVNNRNKKNEEIAQSEILSGSYSFDALPNEKIAEIATATKALVKQDTLSVFTIGKTIHVTTTAKNAEAFEQINVALKEMQNEYSGSNDNRKHILFETSFISVNEKKVNDFVNMHLEKNTDGLTREHILDSKTSSSTLGSFTHDIVWTFVDGMNTYKLTAGFVLEEGIGSVVSRPLISVREGETASFTNQVLVPYETVSQNGTAVDLKPAGIILRIEDPRIINEPTPGLRPGDPGYEPATIEATFHLEDGNANMPNNQKNYTLNKITVDNSGRFKNLESKIVASLIKENQAENTFKVPLLHRLPVIGKKLFSQKEKTSAREEIIVLVRPVIEDGSRIETSLHASRNRDSIKLNLVGARPSVDPIYEISEPLHGAYWNSGADIYGTKGFNDKYWNLRNKFSENEIRELGVRFLEVRNRVNVLGQSEKQIELQIINDPTLKNIAIDTLQSFNEDNSLNNKRFDKCENCWKLEKAESKTRDKTSGLETEQIASQNTKNYEASKQTYWKTCYECSHCNISPEKLDSGLSMFKNNQTTYQCLSCGYCVNSPIISSYSSEQSNDLNKTRKALAISRGEEKEKTKKQTIEKAKQEDNEKTEQKEDIIKTTFVESTKNISFACTECAGCSKAKFATVCDMLVAAAHTGIINKQYYDIYAKALLKPCDDPLPSDEEACKLIRCDYDNN